ncbi:hypothetical protein CR513_53243, partial [Mucuna pruriens]
MKMIIEFKKYIMKTFEIINLKATKYDKVLEVDARYKSLIESLLYLSNTTKHHVRHIRHRSSIKVHAKTKSNFFWSKILRYLQIMKEFGIWHKVITNLRLIDYSDCNLTKSIYNMKNTSKCFFSLRLKFFSLTLKIPTNTNQQREYIT